MKKLVIAAMLAMLLFAAPVFGAYGRRAYLVSIVDCLHEKNDEVTSFTVNIAGSTAATIYANASTTTAATNPIVDSSTATDVTTLTDGYVVFWYAGATCDIILSNDTYTKTHSSVTPRNTRLMYDSHLYTAMTEFELLDAENISFGDGDDWVAQCAAATVMTWTPFADHSAFNIGVSGTDLNSDFNVYVGTALGLKVDEGTPSLIWDGGVATLNHNSDFSVGICTGTCTANTSIGSDTAGTIALDTTAGITANADDSIAITVSAGTALLQSTGGDITIDSTDKSVIIDGAEADDAAVVLVSAGGGLDVDVAKSICLTTTESESDSVNIDSAGGVDIDISGGGTGEDFAVTTDTSITLTTSEAVADQFKLDATGAVAGNAINFETTSGGIILTADHATNGNITLDAENDIILTTTGKLTITNTEAMTVSGASTLTGAATCTAGIQAASVTLASAVEGSQATIVAGSSWVTVTVTNDADDAIILPAGVIGNVIRIIVPATGCELQTAVAGSDTINAVDCSGTNEMAMAAGSLYTLICTKANTWIATGVGADGAHQATILPDAD